MPLTALSKAFDLDTADEPRINTSADFFVCCVSSHIEFKHQELQDLKSPAPPESPPENPSPRPLLCL